MSDSGQRRAIFARVAQLYAQAAELSGDREPVPWEIGHGPLAAWLVPASGIPIASAVVIGGVEGWAVDFDSIAEALATRGVDAVGPAPGSAGARP